MKKTFIILGVIVFLVISIFAVTHFIEKNQPNKMDDFKTEINVEPASNGAAIVYRSQLTGFAKNEADKTCYRLKKANKSCIVVASQDKQQLVMANQ